LKLWRALSDAYRSKVAVYLKVANAARESAQSISTRNSMQYF